MPIHSHGVKPCARLLAPLLAAAALAAAPARAIDLAGEWYVLVHFEERAPTSPARDEAEVEVGADYRDAVWRFERVGEGLRWTVFPDVGFRDETGRFEEVHGERARLRHAWRPSRAQIEEIRTGLELDPRTARTKTLRRRGPDGFASGAAPRAASASAIAFGEHWQVEGIDGAPVFTLSASLSSGRAGDLEGSTRFAADVVDEAAARMEGSYARDDAQSGRFFMWRKGRVHPDDAAFAAPPADASLFGPGGAARSTVVDLQSLLDRLEAPGARDDAALRMRIRDSIAQLVAESYTRRGRSLHHDRAEIERVVSEIERLCVVEGVPLDEIDRRYAEGALGS